MRIDEKAAAALLREADDILILTHMKPDGDTLGSGFALLWALEKLGKRARVENADGYPSRYGFLYGDYAPLSFEPQYVVSTDVASPDLLGSLAERWADRVDLCIDHHLVNTVAATHTLQRPEVPAASLLVYRIVRELGLDFDPRMATAIFTGLSTDTGCFLFYSVTAETHRAAAEMIEAGAEHGLINKLMFDTKSRGRIAVDTIAQSTLEYHFEGRCAVMTVSLEATRSHGVAEEDLDGIASFPRKIEGVEVGLTMREREDGSYRVSVRTTGDTDAAAICARLGGGGHKNAGGCSISGPLQHAKKIILTQVEQELKGTRP